MLSHRLLLDSAYRVMAGVRRAGARRLPLLHLAGLGGRAVSSASASALLAPLVAQLRREARDGAAATCARSGRSILLFTPRQWEMLASNVQAHMLDAGALRRALYRLGDAHRRGGGRGAEAGMLLRRPALAGRPPGAARAARQHRPASQAHAALSAGSGLSAELFGLFRALGVPLRQRLRLDRIGAVDGALEGPLQGRRPWARSCRPTRRSNAPDRGCAWTTAANC